MMSIVIDLIIVAIIFITVLISAKQGFVRAIIEVAGFVLAIILAIYVSKPLADITYEKIIEPPILNSISENAAGNNENKADSAWENLPSFIKDNSQKLGITKEKIEKAVDDTFKGNDTTLAEISQKSVKPVVTGILKPIYAIILIIVLLFIVKILAISLNKAFSFCVIGKLNHVLGGVLGAVKGIVIALVICELLTLIISFTGDIWIFSNENIAKTYIFKYLINVF